MRAVTFVAMLICGCGSVTEMEPTDGGVCSSLPQSMCPMSCYGLGAYAVSCQSAPDILSGPDTTCVMVTPAPTPALVEKSYCCLPRDTPIPTSGCVSSEAASQLCKCEGLAEGLVCAGDDTAGCAYLPYSGNASTQTHVECCGK